MTRPRALVVEDDRLLRRACEATLQQAGFQTTWAGDGEEALRLASSEPRPDVILLDLMTPKRPGVDVLRELKADRATADIPVLVLSSSSREEDYYEATTLGAVGYHVKVNLSLRALAAEAERIVRRDGRTG